MGMFASLYKGILACLLQGISCMGESYQDSSWNQADYNRFTDLYSDYLNTINYLNMNLFIIISILQVLNFELLKFRI